MSNGIAVEPLRGRRFGAARRAFGRAADRAAQWADPCCRTWRDASIASLLIGVIPVVLCAIAGSGIHQVITALLLGPLVWSCARRGAWRLGLFLLASTFFWHSCVMILLTIVSPVTGSALVPDGDAYWSKQITWISTGSDPEYEWKAWGPAHAQLLFGTTIYSVTSFGLITLQQGFYEVDLMNYYNGRLVLVSQNWLVALMFGWHLWSLLRGCGYVLLTYELTSLGLQLAIGRSLEPIRNRCFRWTAGISFLILDATVKWYLLETVRQQLFSNLA